jgi:hypothetical protein
VNKILKGPFDRNEKNANGVRRWATLFDIGALSTAETYDTKQFETTWLTPEGSYFELQASESEGEAFVAHVFWTKKIEEGFVPTESLFDNFSIGACIRFLENIKKHLQSNSDKSEPN